MRQYRAIKAQCRDAILFFRMGDFYEMFEEDAKVAARELGLTLTARNNGGAAAVPLAGVPVKAAQMYLKKLLAGGHRVAICEQVEDPKLAKGIVRREIVETLTPGALVSEDWLDGSRNNFLVAVTIDGARGALAAADLSTGEVEAQVVPVEELPEAIARYAPSELIAAEETEVPPVDGALQTRREAWEFDVSLGESEITRHYGLSSLDGLGFEERDRPAIGAAGALLRYLGELRPEGLPHLGRPRVVRPGHLLPLDEMTRRNLELIEPLRSGTTGATLVEALDRTVTPMGSRLLRRHILEPLVDTEAINRRLDAVEVLVHDGRGRSRLRDELDGVRDLERLSTRAALGRATPREMGALRDSLLRLPNVLESVSSLDGRERSALLDGIARSVDVLADLAELLHRALVDRPPAMLGDGDTIRPGYDEQLTELIELRDGGKQHIAQMQARERDRTGISSLKIGFNKVFGYYIEVTRANLASVPAEYERRQTLANAERYVTPDLKDYEARVLNAEERIGQREAEVFDSLRKEAGSMVDRLQRTSHQLAQVDVAANLAEVAQLERYVRPEIDDEFNLELVGCRHPVLERLMPRDAFIPNTVRADQAERVLLITGPNMAGKSTILRQVGLAVLMAQMGSFVPADSARIGVVDRLYTRVGASDNLARGQSTFMVEMAETSSILHGATDRSLVLLDEIGRGTSTYDGVAIAWAVTEHLHNVLGCKALFATHYHELLQLTETLAHVRNLNVAVREAGGTIVFLHRLEPGGTDRSYGIHVGELAGLPPTVVERAWELLRLLEAGHHVVGHEAPPAPNPDHQLALFETRAHPAVARLKDLDVESLTPLEALNRLAELKREVES